MHGPRPWVRVLLTVAIVRENANNEGGYCCTETVEWKKMAVSVFCRKRNKTVVYLST